MTLASPSETLGYEARRPELATFVQTHYIDRFDLQPGQSILDAGCGDGFWADLFARAGFSVHGVDRDREAIHLARQRCLRGFAEHAYEPGLLPTFTAGDLLEPRLRGFDAAIVFARTLPHFYQPDLGPATALLAQLARRALPTVRILLSVYTDETGTDHGTDARHAVHHTLPDLLAAAFAADLRLEDHARANGYLQLLLH